MLLWKARCDILKRVMEKRMSLVKNQIGHQPKFIYLWLVLLLIGWTPLVWSGGINFFTLQILALIGLFSFMGCIATAIFHRHTHEKDAEHCLLCQTITRIRRILPGPDLMMILSMVSTLLHPTDISFTIQSQLSTSSARAPPYSIS